MTENAEQVKIGGRSALMPRLSHTFVGNEAFYAAVPDPYRDYYWRFVRQYFQWYDGYVPSFHSHHSGIFSTRIAYTLLHKLAKQITGSKILFDDNGLTHNITHDGMNSLQFAERFAKDTSLSNKITQAVEWALAGGDSLLKLDQRAGKLNVSVLRKDNFLVSTNFNGDIEKSSVLLYSYQDAAKQGKHEQRVFYLLEERAFEDGVPKERVTIKEGSGDRIPFKNVDFHSANTPFQNLPEGIKKRLAKEFPNTIFGEWYELPFDDLGVYQVKASERVSFAPAIQGGESLLSNIISELMSYDFYFSTFMTDMYIARGKILVPQHHQGPQSNNEFTSDGFKGFDEFLMTKVPYVDPDGQKPTPIQFDTRIVEWREARNLLLQMMATKLGISERTIATYLVPASEKPTAYEISSDENATSNFVEGIRPFATEALDKLLAQVLKYHNFGDEYVLTKFSRIGLTNFNNVVNQVTILKQNGLIDQRSALEKLYPDLTQSQLDEMQKLLAEEQEKALQEKEVKSSKSDVLEATEDIHRSGINTTPKPSGG